MNREPVQEQAKSPEELEREREVRAKLKQLQQKAVDATKAEALREFADAHRFPSHWIMFRRDDGSGVTVGDLLRETANRLEGKTDAE